MDRIVADSCCDLTPELKDAMGVISVPLTMIIGEQEYRDDENLDIAAFMDALKDFKGKPGSSAPPPHLFKQAIASKGDTYIVTLSGKLSATYSNALIGKNQAEDDSGGDAYAHVFDSKSASAGETLIVLKLFEYVSMGLHRTAIVEKLNRFISGMKTYFVLENFDNLQKNGRMSKVQSSFAQILNIKIIAGSDGNGEIALYGKCRGMQSLKEKLMSLIESSGRATPGADMVITHCNNRSFAEEIRALITERFSFNRIFVVPTGGLSSLYADDKGVILAF